MRASTSEVLPCHFYVTECRMAARSRVEQLHAGVIDIRRVTLDAHVVDDDVNKRDNDLIKNDDNNKMRRTVTLKRPKRDCTLFSR